MAGGRVESPPTFWRVEPLSDNNLALSAPMRAEDARRVALLPVRASYRQLFATSCLKSASLVLAPEARSCARSRHCSRAPKCAAACEGVARARRSGREAPTSLRARLASSPRSSSRGQSSEVGAHRRHQSGHSGPHPSTSSCACLFLAPSGVIS